MEPRKYYYNNSTLTIIFDDILHSKAEVIVSSDDTAVDMVGGLSGAIRKAGGDYIRTDAQKKRPAQVGDVIVSTSGDLEHQKYIFHCLTVNSEHKSEVFNGLLSHSDDINNYILRHSVDKCFRLMQALDLTSIAFPCIGAGLAHIPLKKVAEVMADAISSNLCITQKPFNVELYLYQRTGYDNDSRVMTEMDYIDMFENFAIKAALYRYGVETANKERQEPAKKTDETIIIPKRDEMKHLVFISYSKKDTPRWKS
ncbi:MAG: macro domain-containing protein [Bacteroidales bacterium]|nr:macro domain-containing protein [Bacteroidales bacterium]